MQLIEIARSEGQWMLSLKTELGGFYIIERFDLGFEFMQRRIPIRLTIIGSDTFENR